MKLDRQNQQMAAKNVHIFKGNIYWATFGFWEYSGEQNRSQLILGILHIIY